MVLAALHHVLYIRATTTSPARCLISTSTRAYPLYGVNDIRLPSVAVIPAVAVYVCVVLLPPGGTPARPHRDTLNFDFAVIQCLYTMLFEGLNATACTKLSAHDALNRLGSRNMMWSGRG